MMTSAYLQGAPVDPYKVVDFLGGDSSVHPVGHHGRYVDDLI